MPCHFKTTAGAILAALLTTATASGGGWTLPDSQLGRQTAPLLLLSRPEIQADLKLDAATIAAVEQAIADLHAKAFTLRGRRDAEAVAARRAIDEAQRAWLEANLDASQRARLVQLDLQWEGPAALHTRKSFGETLRLTEAQRKEVGSAVTAREAHRPDAKRNPKSDDAALAETVLTLLTPEQRERWKTMLGPACHFRPSAATAAANPPAPTR